MSSERPQDITFEDRVWVAHSCPIESRPPLGSNQYYGFYQDRPGIDSGTSLSFEERRRLQEVLCELTPGFERRIRDQRQLKQPTPTSSREVADFTKWEKLTIWQGLNFLTEKMRADGVPGFDIDFVDIH